MLLDHAAAGQATLEYLERANLFIVPLDNERRWYRYHHLFADLLRQRLQQSSASSPGMGREWPNCTFVPANGMKTMAWRLKLFTMPRPPMMLSAPSA